MLMYTKWNPKLNPSRELKVDAKEQRFGFRKDICAYTQTESIAPPVARMQGKGKAEKVRIQEESCL